VSVLLDTCIISELCRATADPRVRNAVGRRSPDELFLSVITLGELRTGVALLPAGQKRSGLEGWLEELQHEFADRVLPVDLETSHIWGEITARGRLKGEQVPATDGLIAATALRHGFQIMTRNTRHFEASGALVVNPWRDDERLA